MRLGYYKLACTMILYDIMQSHSTAFSVGAFNAVVVCCYIQCELKDVGDIILYYKYKSDRDRMLAVSGSVPATGWMLVG